MQIEASLAAMLHAQRAAFLRDMPVSLETRRDRLRRGAAMLVAHQDRLHQAVMQDFGVRGPEWTLLAEVFASLQVFEAAHKQVHRWMRPQRREAPMPFRLFGAKAQVQYQPLGVVGIMGAWNAALNLVLVPLATTLAAGNRAILCPSDMMPNAAVALDVAVREYFDPEEVAVAHGGLEVCKAFSRLPFDHLMFTGSPEVGAQVMAAAAPNLTPVTLELGGKCPVVIADDADIEDAAQRIVGGKTLNGGQACLAPDLLMVPSSKVEALLQAMDGAACSLYPDAAADANYCGIVNQRHFRRIDSLVEEAAGQGARVVPLGIASEQQARDESRHRMGLRVIVNPPPETRARHEEIFGPVMVVLSYDDTDAMCAQLRTMPKPLGLYIFSRSASFRQYVLDRTFSGGVTLGDVLFHYSVPDLPFGGVGRSGLGTYSFGIEGFRRFSHGRSIYTQAGPRSLMSVLHPPYGRLFRVLIRGTLKRRERVYASVPKRSR